MSTIPELGRAMAIDRNNLAIYLDELGDDPIKACEMARAIGISSICLRKVWATNIGRATDDACKQLLVAIKRNNLSVLAVCTDDGRVRADQLAYNEIAKRSITIAAYFKSKFYRPFTGMRSPHHAVADRKIDDWMAVVATECLRAGVAPIMEADPDSYLFEPADIAAAIGRHPGWRWQYDPALLVIKRNQNPMVRYWYLLRSHASIIDLHDFKVGTGFVQVGTGNCYFEDTIRDCLSNNYGGHLVIEPGIARRAGANTDRTEIVQAAITNYMEMIGRGKEAITAWNAGQLTKKKEVVHGPKRA